MDKPELDAMVEEAMASLMGNPQPLERRIILHDLVSKVEFRTAKRFVDCEVQCPEPLCEGGYKDYPLKRHWKCHFCKGTMTVPLAVRDRWVAEQVIEEACCSEVSTEHGPYANVAELRVDLDEWADGRFRA